MGVNNYSIVKQLAILKRMQKAGFILFCKDTGTKKGAPFTTKKLTVTYVEDYGPAANNSSFEFEGSFYRIQYFDGCFYPFVVEFTPVHRTFGQG